MSLASWKAWVAVGGIALWTACASDGDRDVRRPDHVFVVIVDTLRSDALGCYGNPFAPTPHIDALARDGVRFDQAISSSGWTLPSVATLLTGTWPTLHKARGKRTRLTPITEDLPTGPELFQREGWSTFGFANAAFLSPLLGLSRGFGVFDHQHAYNWKIRNAEDTLLALLTLLDHDESPRRFFLAHLFDPHLDYDPPEALRQRFAGGPPRLATPLTMSACRELERDGVPSDADLEYVRAMYLAECAYVDAQIGRFVAGLRSRGLYDDSLIVFVSDHGEEFWEHRGFEHGHTLYDELIRVPLIIKPPAFWRAEVSQVEAQVRTVDVLPTIFDLVGIDSPASFAGRSLVPLMRGEETESADAFSESTLYGADKVALRQDPYKMIFDRSAPIGQREELYNWREDPGELHNLVDSAPEVAKRLRRELMELYGDLQERATDIRRGEVRDMSPSQLEETLRALRELGYLRDEPDQSGDPEERDPGEGQPPR